MDGEGQCAAYAQDSAESGCAGAQVGFLAQELHGVAFFLEGISLGVGGAVDFESVGLYLAALAFAHRLNEFAGDMDRRAGGDRLQLFVGETAEVENNLEIAHCRTVVECYELHIFITAAGADPAFYLYLRPYQRGVEDITYLRSFHLKKSQFLISNHKDTNK